MYSKIVLSYFVLCFVFVKCNLNKEEGAECEWEGVKGTCVSKYRCFTYLDRSIPKQPVCSEKGEDTIICCTDCELVNDTRIAVLTPTNTLYWKTGQKSFDRCLDYIINLPYDCHTGYYSRVTRTLNEETKCHYPTFFGIGGPPSEGRDPVNEYPETALLGYGDKVESATWNCGGAIISDKYVLTAAHCMPTASNDVDGLDWKPIKYVAFGLIDRSTPAQDWQYVAVKRTIQHPDYKHPSKYNDIALIETETLIKFNKNVLPACLYTTDADDTKARVSTWRDTSKESNTISNKLNYIAVNKYGKSECTVNAPSSILERGFDETTQLCYGDKEHPTKACKSYAGAPLTIKTQISWCIHTVVGVSSYSIGCQSGFDVYTKVAYYVPWIESIVWAE